MTPPLLPGSKKPYEPIDIDSLNKAIDTVKTALRFFTPGWPIVKRGLREVHVDLPIMYIDFAVDRVHYDPILKAPSPKGRPVRVEREIKLEEIRNAIEKALREAYVIEAAEFREPEDAWVIPVAWKKMIILHVKVSRDGEEIVPDYGLTEEVRRHVDL